MLLSVKLIAPSLETGRPEFSRRKVGFQFGLHGLCGVLIENQVRLPRHRQEVTHQKLERVAIERHRVGKSWRGQPPLVEAGSGPLVVEQRQLTQDARVLVDRQAGRFQLVIFRPADRRECVLEPLIQCRRGPHGNR